MESAKFWKARMRWAQGKATNEKALKIIGLYMKNNILKGFILSPSRQLKIECYPDT